MVHRFLLAYFFLASLSFLGQTNCPGRDTVEYEQHNNGRFTYESFYCNDSCYKVNIYRRSTRLIGTIYCYSYTPDTVVTNVYYRKNGSVIIKERQVNGKDDGDYVIYYPEGSVKLEAKNNMGRRFLEKKYDKKGRLIYSESCSSGDTCIIKYFDKNGELLKEKLNNTEDLNPNGNFSF